MPTWTNSIITAGLLLLLISNSSVAVQVDSNDAGSQRILPLPDGQLSNAQTQMQLLQKLRSLVTGTPDEPQAEASSSNSREAKDEQLEQLLNALKKLRDQLPPGIKPPDLDSIPKDQLKEAISNPAVQQQMKQMLEQFSRDGQLPKAGSNSDEPSQHSLRAFQDLLQRYRNSQQGNHQNSADGFSESRDGTLPEIRPGARSQHPESQEKFPEQDASSRVLRRPDRLKPVEPFGTPEPGPDENNLERFPPEENFPQNTPFGEANRDGEANRGQSESRRRSGIENEPDSSDGLIPDGLIPSVSEFLKEQLRKGFPAPNGGHRENTEHGETPPRIDQKNSRSQGFERPEQSSQSAPGNSSEDGAPPAIDIRRELERRGIRGTIEKLVQKAREESRSQQRTQQKSLSRGTDAGHTERPSSPSGSEAISNATPGKTTDAGLQKSLRDLLAKLDIDLGDVIKDARFREPETHRGPNRDVDRQTAPIDSESRLKSWNDAASQFFSDLSKAPDAPPAEQSRAADDTSAASPLEPGVWFVTGLGVLGLLVVMTFCIRRPLLKIVSAVTGFAVSNGSRSPAEIRSRADIVSAFHELVLNPGQLVEAWWTHRAAAQKLAAESPQQEHAVRTLAEIYEQARYLPDDVELPTESLQSARAAFQECRL